MPEERLMSISSSSHLAPDDVARHTFGSVRRGFDPDEVRTYLESLAAGLRSIGEREHQLLQELADAEYRAAHPVLDEPTLTSALGNETARVLHSAHEVAAEMVAKSEAEANRLLTEAREEVQQSRSQTEAQLAEQTADSERTANELRERTTQQVATRLEAARRDADDLLAQAREQCRDMVDEAQRLRARVLADLSKRRKVLHAQIEQLRAGRERLAETVSDVRKSIDAIADDLFAAEDNARLAAEAAGREVLGRPDEGTPEEIAALLLANEAEQGDEVVRSALDSGPEEPGLGDLVEVVEVVEVLEVVEVQNVTDRSEDDQPEEEDHDGPEGLDGDRAELSSPDGETGSDATPDDSPVDALFAKIRAARESPVGGDEPPRPDETEPTEVLSAGDRDTDETEDGEDEEDGPPEERNPFAVRRDGLIDPIVTTLARRLKRTLQDSQNELLDSLRSNGSHWTLELLPPVTEHLDSYATAAMPALEQAAHAGVAFVGSGTTTKPSDDELLGIAHELAGSVVGPLRRRLSDDEGLVDAEESVLAEHVGSAFREWKGERIERLAGDHVVAAFSAGTIAAASAEASAPLEWVAVSSSGDEPCPDCEDNGLNGSQQPGEEFPTGHRYPPVHPGCRCLLALAAT